MTRSMNWGITPSNTIPPSAPKFGLAGVADARGAPLVDLAMLPCGPSPSLRLQFKGLGDEQTPACSRSALSNLIGKCVQYQLHRLCVAPMMDWTDRHCRVFHRILSRHALLYTEMVTAEAVIHGNRERLLGYSDVEHPIALQLGGRIQRSSPAPQPLAPNGATTRSISTSAARPIAYRRAASAPASWPSLSLSPAACPPCRSPCQHLCPSL